jgi:hypothetical protein
MTSKDWRPIKNTASPIFNMSYEQVKQGIVTGDIHYGNIPVSRQTAELNYLAVVNFEYNIGYIPYADRTKEICLEILKSDTVLFDEIPTHLIDYELCVTAVQKNPHNFKEIPDEFKTSELCLLALKNGREENVMYWPDRWSTIPMHMAAMQVDACVLNYIPAKYKTEEFFKAVLKLDKYIQLRDIPESLRTLNVCRSILAKESFNGNRYLYDYQFIPCDLLEHFEEDRIAYMANVHNRKQMTNTVK